MKITPKNPQPRNPLRRKMKTVGEKKRKQLARQSLELHREEQIKKQLKALYSLKQLKNVQ